MAEVADESVVEWTPKARAVLEAASRLFYDRGIHAVGVDLIASEAGVTKKTLYDRFGSKDRLVVEYLRDRDARWREFLADRLPVDADPAERLRAVFDASAVWTAVHSTKGCSMVKAHSEISDPSHPAYRVMAGQKTWMLDLFADIVADAGEREAPGMAETIMLLHEGALVAHGMRILDDPIGRARDAALEIWRLNHH